MRMEGITICVIAVTACVVVWYRHGIPTLTAVIFLYQAKTILPSNSSNNMSRLHHPFP